MLELHKRNLLKDVKSCKLGCCKYYVFGKQRRVSFKVASHTSKGVLDYVHMFGDQGRYLQMEVNIIFASFINDFSRKI